MACRHTYKCDECGLEDSRIFDDGAGKLQWIKCSGCGQRAYWAPKAPQITPDIGVVRMSTLKPLEYTHATRGKTDVVEGRAALAEHIKKYNGKYGTDLVTPK